MKITSKTIAIISSIVVAGSAGAMYYLENQDEPEVLGWMDANWTFRKSIEVANSAGEILTDENVLIEIDTESLISSSKLQSDCDDLRFVDSDGETSIDYWVEGGCNTANTRVWVEIPSLPIAGQNIYFYYGNPSAVNAELAWTDNFILLADDSCPTGWTRFTALDDKFPYASSSYGTTGGSSSHAHGGSLYMSSIGPGSSSVTISGTGMSGALSTHTHTATTTIGTTSNVLPPYLTMLFCSKNKLENYTNLITIYDDVTLPTGWSRFSALDNKFPYGGSTYGATGGDTTHVHTASDPTSSSVSGGSWAKGTDPNVNPASVHTHTVYTNLLAANHVPPYSQIIFAKAGTNSIIDIPIIGTESLPPLGWEAFSSINDTFLYGASTFSVAAGGEESHIHTINITTSGPSASNSGRSTTGTRARASHTHSTTVYTDTDSNIPPYLSIVYVKRKPSQSITILSEETSNTATNPPSSLLTEGETNPTMVLDTTPEFSAIFTDPDEGDTGNYYQIQVNTQSNFAGTTMWDSTKTAFEPVLANGARSPDISYAGTSLEWGTTYYWRMKFWDNNEFEAESSWSATANFTMDYNPNSPSSLLTEGLANPSKASLIPYFSAIFSDDDTPETGTHYQILVNTESDFTGTTMWDSTKTQFGSPITNGSRSSNITYAGTTLEEGTAYYWKIRFWDENDLESVYSGVANFLTESGPSAPSGLLFDGRPNPTYLLSTTPPFSAIYSDINGDSASAYQINVNSNNLFTGTVIWNSGKQSITVANGARSSDITYDGTALINSKNIYYWRIRFWDSDDMVGEWSSTSYFTDSTVPQFIMEGLSLQGIKID